MSSKNSNIKYHSWPMEPANESYEYMTIEENRKYSKSAKIRDHGYAPWVDGSFGAIDVPIPEAIPSDYSGVMAVPLFAMLKQGIGRFEVLGVAERKGCVPRILIRHPEAHD